jgi:Zn-dependent protease with chaperone function
MSPSSSHDPAGWQNARRQVSRLRLLAIVVWTLGIWVWAADRPWQGHWRLGIYLAGVAILWFLATALSDLVLARRYGLIHESAWDWTRRRLKATLYAAVFLAVAVGPLPSAMTWWPRHWWLPMTLWLAGAWLAWTALIPGVVLPRLLDIRPLAPGPVADALTQLAEKAGQRLPVAVWHLAERSTAIQAVVVGLGPTQRLLLTDTLLATFAPAEVAGVVAHELSHLERHDLLRRGAVLTLGLGTVLATAAGVTTGTTWDLPILALVAILVVLGYFRYLRALELRADRRAVELTGDRAAYGATLRAVAMANGDSPSARGFRDLWETHPGLTHRIKKLGLDG